MSHPNRSDKPHVVILGGGFGGLYTAKHLKNAPVQITLIDKRNFHLFQPLLYQVATGSLSPADIASPLRVVLHNHANTKVLLDEAIDLDPEQQKVILKDHEPIAYDILIVATGVSHHYFGKEQWRPLAPGLKTIEDALEMRRRIFLAFEAAEKETDPIKQQAWLTFVGNVLDLWSTFLERCQRTNCNWSYPQIQNTTHILSFLGSSCQKYYFVS
jgi:NADH dehydrogenase